MSSYPSATCYDEVRAAPDSFLASAWLAQDWALLVAEDGVFIIVPDWALALSKHELMNDFLASPDSFLAEASALQFVIFVCCVLAANADDGERRHHGEDESVRQGSHRFPPGASSRRAHRNNFTMTDLVPLGDRIHNSGAA